MRRIISLFIVLIIIIGISPVVQAGVSTSAVLFLRIAAGARAAGMGEAFVAVADDATATHWNPAGLGNYPLSSKWFEVDVPDNLKPLRQVALFQNDATEIDHNKYDIWALSDAGLVRYSRNKWYQGDIIETRPDQTAESILRDYTGLQSEQYDAKIANLMDIVGDANNSQPRYRIDSIANKVMGSVPPEYAARDDIENALFALKASYNQCLIDWDRFERIETEYRSITKDSTLSESEADRLLFAVEKARKRFLDPEITIPFGVNFEGELSDLDADKTYLWVTSDSGLYRYDRSKWRHFTESENLPLKGITKIELNNKRVYLATESGLVIYSGGMFELQDSNKGLPNEQISGIAPSSDGTAWAVVGGDLYYYDGKLWQNYMNIQDVLDQTPESIYQSMKIFDTPEEKSNYLKKYESINSEVSTSDVQEAVPETSTTPEPVDSLGVVASPQLFPDSSGIRVETDTANSVVQIPPDSGQAIDSTASALGAMIQPIAGESESIGRALRIPYTAGIPFKVTSMETDTKKNLWIGTEYGLLKFDGREWKWYGYRDYTAENDMAIFDLATKLVGGDEKRAQRMATNIKTVNMLQSDSLLAGQKVKTYANPAGSQINDISPIGERIYFGTESGTIFLENGWGRYNEAGLGSSQISRIMEARNNMWFASENDIMVRAAGRSELVMMHVNWLPELANDIYYEFFSFVKNVEGWGTIGSNITFLSYGSITRTDANANVLGEFSAFDVAVTMSYGTSLSNSLSGGISTKLIYSHLSEQGAGQEKGSGTSTGLALDIGLLYKLNRRLSLGMALTNIGPAIAYIDVAQSDPLPRNLAVGLAWTAIASEYSHLLITAEANKSMVAIGGLNDELKEVVLNGGMEYWYGSFIALRAGYIYDQEGDIKTPTLGFGLSYSKFKFDFAYIPSSEAVPLANTMRLSLGIGL
jgi:hypothetical protein